MAKGKTKGPRVQSSRRTPRCRTNHVDHSRYPTRFSSKLAPNITNIFSRSSEEKVGYTGIGRGPLSAILPRDWWRECGLDVTTSREDGEACST